MSNVEPAPQQVVCHSGGLPGVATECRGRAPVEIITSRAVPLGGPRAMTVHRTLPQRQRSLIGPWCFVDHYGPDDVSATGGMDVAPHPHTGLQTVSWLFEGAISHIDSGGSTGTVLPGEVNLMTAGVGICHSEVSTPHTSTLHGVQLWLALPDADRHEQSRRFEHHVPEHVRVEGVGAEVVAGSGESGAGARASQSAGQVRDALAAGQVRDGLAAGQATAHTAQAANQATQAAYQAPNQATHPAAGGELLVFLGVLHGVRSPVKTYSPVVGAELRLDPHATVDLAVDPAHEHGILVDAGDIEVEDVPIARRSMAYTGIGVKQLRVRNRSSQPGRVLVLGGEPFGEEIVMWWNFVGRTHAEIEQFRADWEAHSARFGEVAGYVGTRADGKNPEGLDRLPAPTLPKVNIRPRANCPPHVQTPAE